MELQQVEW